MAKTGVTGTVVVTDKGAAAVMRNLGKGNARWMITVGIHEKEGAEDHDGLTTAQLGEIHELGLGVPRRSFIADWADENREKHEDAFRRIGKLVASGRMDTEVGMKRLGVFLAADCQARIVSQPSSWEPLAESTIKAKGSSSALIDTGVLKSSITSKVTKL